MNSIFTSVAAGTQTDFSLEKKSPWPSMVATVVLESADQVAHRVRVLLGVVLDGFRRAAVGVAFAQDRVDGAAHDLGVAGLDVLLGVGRGGFSGRSGSA